jgi:hypothetical protein
MKAHHASMPFTPARHTAKRLRLSGKAARLSFRPPAFFSIAVADEAPMNVDTACLSPEHDLFTEMLYATEQRTPRRGSSAEQQ